MKKFFKLIIVCLLMTLIMGCTTTPPESCPQHVSADLFGALAYADDDQLEFQFPLDELGNDVRNPDPAVFCSKGCNQSGCEYHAAEDYHLPAGTPVYAIADGNISFSGPMGGYGWLIIINHPQANIYSLYGHLSPSRWRLESGIVEKGDLIAYLGDPDENGGSVTNPLRTHLHFGIRVGQRTDYPGMGEWRWQAGWIKPCPADLGWLQPSSILTNQEIPPGGFPILQTGLFEKWGAEILFIGIYWFGGICVLVVALRKKNYIFPAIGGFFLTVAGWVFSGKGAILSYAIFFMAILLFVFAIVQYVRHSKKLGTAVQKNKKTKASFT